MFAGAAVLITEVCPYCTKGRSLADLMPFGGTRICQQCYRNHIVALQALSGGPPPDECSECHVKTRELLLRPDNGDNGVRMAVHFENGIYRFLCTTCSPGYVPKRRELYGPTEYGHKLGLN